MSESRALAWVIRNYMWDEKIGPKELARRLGFTPGASSEDPGKGITDLCSTGTTIHFPALKKLFHERALTPEYLSKDLPASVEAALREAYPGETFRSSGETNVDDFYFGSSPIRILPRSADFSPVAIEQLSNRYTGVWDVLRYAHKENRIVRAAMIVHKPEPRKFGHPFPHFEIFYRTSKLVADCRHLPEKDQGVYRTDGAILPLKGGKYMLFTGIENTGYPLFIVAKIVLNDPNFKWGQEAGPSLGDRAPVQRFSGIVSRHHIDDGVFFSMPVMFIRSLYNSRASYPLAKIRTWPEEESIVENLADIPNLKSILEILRSYWPTGGRGSLQG